MRQGQNKRPRNRSNGRKNSNPLTRHYDSNGPDVKVRGIASHVAERYVQLARDAASSGDSVMAENYFQHAEHYNRIISSAQASQNARMNENQPRVNPSQQEQEDAEQLNQPVEASQEQAPEEQPSSEGLAAVPDNVAREEFEQAEKPQRNGDAGEKTGGRVPRTPRSRTRRRSAPKDLAANADPAEAPQPSILKEAETPAKAEAPADAPEAASDAEASAQA